MSKRLFYFDHEVYLDVDRKTANGLYADVLNDFDEAAPKYGASLSVRGSITGVIVGTDATDALKNLQTIQPLYSVEMRETLMHELPAFFDPETFERQKHQDDLVCFDPHLQLEHWDKTGTLLGGDGYDD